MKKPIETGKAALKIGKGLFGNSIRVKLLWVLVIILIIPMSIGIIHAVRTFEKYAEGQAHENVKHDLIYLSTICENKSRQIETLAKSIAMDNAVRVTTSLGKESLLCQQLGGYLDKFIKKDVIDFLIITDDQGGIIAQKGVLELKDDYLSENEMLKRALHGEVSVSYSSIPKEKSRFGVSTDSLDKKVNKRLVILITYPLDYDEKTVGAVVAGCILNVNLSLKKEMERDLDISFALLQDSHVILTNLRDQEGILLFGKEIHWVSPDNGGEKKNNFGKVTIGTKDYIYHSCSIYDIAGEEVAVLIALKDADSIKATKTETIKGMAVILVLGLVLAILLVILVGYRFTKPIMELVERTETIARGDLSSPIVVKSRDEIGVLATSFNRMTEALKGSQKQLIAARDYTNNIIRSMNDTLIVVSPAGNIQTVNVAVCDLLGYNEGELIGQPVRNIFAEEVLPSNKEELQNLISKDYVSNVEKVYLSKDGRKIPVLFSSSAMRSKDDEIQGIVFVALDITERKRAEEALRKSEGKLNAMLLSIGDHMSMMDKDLNIIWANETARKGFGDDIIGKKCYKVYHNRDKPCEPYPCLTLKAFQDGKAHDHYTQVTNKEGEIRHFHCTANVSLRNEAEKAIGVMEVSRDITEQKLSEEALAEAHSQLESVLNSATQVSVISTDPEGLITVFNPGSERMLGYTAEEMIGKQTPVIIHLESEVTEHGKELSNEFGYPIEGFEVFVCRAQRGGYEEREWTYVKKDGAHITVNLVVTAMRNEAGVITGFLGVAQDITERNRAEQQIKTSLEEKEVLLKEIHHRVKNNMQVISSLLDLQSRNIKDKESLAMFRDSQSRVKSMALIHEKLYQAKDLAQIDFADYTRNLTNYLFRSFGVDSRNIKLSIHIDNIQLGVDHAVPCGLIINEFVSNSLKHAFPDGRDGEINIDANKIGDSELILTVRDNGIGFPGEVDFQNTDSLGLQLVNTLTRQLRGTIALETNSGTLFTITFPILETQKERGRIWQK